MKRQRPEGNVFIYCDDPSHPKRVAVTNFHPVAGEPGRWEEFGRDSGETMVDDRPFDDQWRHDANLSNYRERENRARYRLACRKCGDRGALQAREENLFGALEAVAGHGVSEISLLLLAATVDRIST